MIFKNVHQLLFPAQTNETLPSSVVCCRCCSGGRTLGRTRGNCTIEVVVVVVVVVEKWLYVKKPPVAVLCLCELRRRKQKKDGIKHPFPFASNKQLVDHSNAF